MLKSEIKKKLILKKNLKKYRSELELTFQICNLGQKTDITS